MRLRWGQGGFQLCGGAQTPELVQHSKGKPPCVAPQPLHYGLLGRRQPYRAASCPGGLRQPCSATRGRGFCPQLVQGRAEPAAEG